MNENEEERMDPETNLNLKRSKGRPSLLNAANLSPNMQINLQNATNTIGTVILYIITKENYNHY